MKKVVLNNDFGGAGLSKEAYEFMGWEWKGYGSIRCERDDPKLVECVEKLGKRANGGCADLGIEEFDDENYTYYITEYDGAESLELTPIVNLSRLIGMSESEIREYFNEIGILYK